MPDPTSLISVAKGAGILTEVYKDLAQPGVRQVGKALETVLQLGGSVLLPIRLLNETARKFEERKFSEIADRFAKIPEDELLNVTPEIGVPIMDRLSHTEDETLRKMFVELLAKAATSSQVNQAHPNFSNVISSICPDEAILLKHLETSLRHPFLTIEYEKSPHEGSVLKQDLVFIPPHGVIHVNNVSLYLSNLAGLGLIEFIRGSYLTAENSYAELEYYANCQFNLLQTLNFGLEIRNREVQ